MAKAKKRYVCQECGSVASRWQGQCEDCSSWNSLVEEASATVFEMKHHLRSGGRDVTLVSLDSEIKLPDRASTGIAEFDRALGGGLVSGSATLLGGDPGIGKSTLLLQAAANLRDVGFRSPIFRVKKRWIRYVCARGDWALVMRRCNWQRRRLYVTY